MKFSFNIFFNLSLTSKQTSYMATNSTSEETDHKPIQSSNKKQKIDEEDDLKQVQQMKNQSATFLMIDVHEFFNIYNNGSKDIVDFRDKSVFDHSHIVLSINQEIFSLDGDDGTFNDTLNEMVCINWKINDTETDDYAKQRLQERFTKCSLFCLLKVKYTKIKQEYPFLCTDKPNDQCQRIQYPNVIIAGKLYLGTIYDRQNRNNELKDLEIAHFVNTGDDNEHVDILKYFTKASDYIKEALKTDGNKVMVHCKDGISGSSTLIIAYLMKHCGYTLNKAYSHTLKCRPSIYPKQRFYQKLIEYEKKIYDGKSTADANAHNRDSDENYM